MSLWILVMTLTCIKGAPKGQTLDANFTVHKTKADCERMKDFYSHSDSNYYIGKDHEIWTETFKCKKEVVK